METLLDVIGKMEKATAREIATRMQIDIRPALEMLRDHEDRDEIVQINGLWQLPNTGKRAQIAAPAPAPAPAPAANVDKPHRALSADDLINIIAEKGPQTADELAKLAGATARKIASTLALATNRGRVLRRNDNGKFYYCLPAPQPALAPALPPPPAFPELPPIVVPTKIPERQPSPSARNDADFMNSIPVFVKPSITLQVPTLCELGKEIRRTKNRLSRLEKCRAALRVLNNHKRMLTAMTPGPAPSVDAKDGEQ